jgi:predicted sulfurtransferase
MTKRKVNRYPILLLIIGGFFIVIAAVMLFLKNIPDETNQPIQSFNIVTPRVSVEDAKAAFDQKKAVFVDVRSVDAYNVSHLPDALTIPLEELVTRITELDPNQWIITYCT